jgi:Na+-driven multidrug efflux pump
LTLCISSLSLWLFRIVPAWLVVQLGYGIIGVYVAMTVETVIKGFWFWSEYKSREWMKKIL